MQPIDEQGNLELAGIGPVPFPVRTFGTRM